MLLTIALVGVAIAAGIVLGPLLTWQTACVTLVIDEYPLGVLEPAPFGQEDRDALRTSLTGSLHTRLGGEPVDLAGFNSTQGVRDLLLPRMRGLNLRGKDVLLAYVRGQAFVAPPIFDAGGLERASPLSGQPCLLASDCRIAGDRPQEIVPIREVIEAVEGVIDGRQDVEQSGAPADIQAGLASVYGTATDKMCEVLGGMTVGKFLKKHCK